MERIAAMVNLGLKRKRRREEKKKETDSLALDRCLRGLIDTVEELRGMCVCVL